jgi:hypothetical protein
MQIKLRARLGRPKKDKKAAQSPHTHFIKYLVGVFKNQHESSTRTRKTQAFDLMAQKQYRFPLTIIHTNRENHSLKLMTAA